ncbi:molybdenum cofactor biosynthesis F family protein [Nocardia sp. NPDC020380]|uniref:molybdenum cofactor biosynthesis F family protein n=1 Tax=Nocardia sp. NPDC020380 TaxID=3364309 RepID=UPI0037BB81D1
MTSLSDTSTWLPLDGLAPGFDANKGALSQELTGRTVLLTDDDGYTEYRFAADTVEWEHRTQDQTHTGTDRYEAFDIADGLVYSQFHRADEPATAVSLMLDFTTGHALTVHTTIGDPEPGRTRVRQRFTPGRIAGTPAHGPAPAATNTLTGRRALWVYSPEHAYEHVYLSPDWYSWQCLAGPERGLADTDENTIYQLRPGIYVFAWREKVIPCAAVTVADHRDLRGLRSHGALFGLDETGRTPVHFTFGAYGRLLGAVVYPADLDPTR